jgi:hypothetical protein
MIILTTGSRGSRHAAYSAVVTGRLGRVADRRLSRLTARTRHYQERSNTSGVSNVPQHGAGGMVWAINAREPLRKIRRPW